MLPMLLTKSEGWNEKRYYKLREHVLSHLCFCGTAVSRVTRYEEKNKLAHQVELYVAVNVP